MNLEMVIPEPTPPAPDRIENRTFNELHIGDTASIARTLTYKDIELFAIMSGDVNPAHVDEEFAKSDMFHQIIAHGMWGGALISTVLGTQLPGPGAIYLGQSLRFRRPVCLGDTITVTVRVAEKFADKNRITLDCQASNQKGEVVISGTAEVIAPTEKISRDRIILPEVKLLERGRHYRALIDATRGRAPIRTAVVHPVDALSLLGAIEAAKARLIVPVLIGPASRIRAAAQQARLDISPYEIVNTEHRNAAAALAVAMGRELKVEAVMQGSLDADELMLFADTQPGLRTGRCMSHVSALDVSSLTRPLFVTDAVVNISPTLQEKRDIVQNAIDLAHALGIPRPKVALLSAQQNVSAKLPSTLDAAVLCKMADRGQITGAELDGPLEFDVAVSPEAAKAKKVISPVAGHADIVLVPDLEAGSMLVEQLERLADAQVAGVVVGARIPVILVNRTDNTLTRLGSCALALLLFHHTRHLATAASASATELDL
jgi:phosphate acetyltransferase/phosphate butyryltransferase